MAKMSRKQLAIMRCIKENFVKGSVRTTLIGTDSVQVNDWKGESMILTVSTYGDVIDADTKKVYAYDVLPYNGKKSGSKLFKK